MNRQVFAWSVGLCLWAPFAWPQVPSSAGTPDQLVEAAMARNREFLSLQQRVRETQGLLKQARVGLADTLEVSGLAGQAVGNAGEDSVSLTYAHTFETFGKRSKRVAVAEKEVALAQAEWEERRRTLTFEVKMHYADAAAEQQKLAVMDRLFGLNRESLRLTDARVQKGDAAPLEAELLRVEFNRNQAQRALTEGRVRSTVLELQQALDRPATDTLAVTSTLLPPSLADDLSHLKELALRQRPDLALLRLGEEQAERQTTLAKAETKPNLTVSGQYVHADSAFDQFGLTGSRTLTPIRDHDDLMGVGLAIPLTTARRNRGNIEASVARQAGLKLRREYLESIIPTQVEAAYRRWRGAKEAAAVLSSGVIEQSEKNLAVIRQAYNLGELRLIDVLNEQRRLLDTELSYIDTQADLFRAYVELEQAVGGSLP